MGIFRTNNPLEYDEVDGIIIDEQAPDPQVRSAGTGVILLAGVFQRGPEALTRISSIKNFHELYGKDASISGNIQLKNKKFSVLKIVRVQAAAAVAAFKTFPSITPVDTIKFTAKYKGVYGNSIQVKVEAGSTTGRKYTVKDLNTGAAELFPEETYDNVVITAVGTTFSNSKLIDVTVLSTLLEPVVAAFTALATGSNGTVADTDYETAIEKCEAEGAGNVLFLDVYNQTRNGYLKIHAGLTQDKMVICSEEEADTVSDNETDSALLRDSDGRIIYASNWVKTLVSGVDVYTNPASWLASIISQTSPHIDPAYSGNTEFLFGIRGLKKDPSRDDFKRLMATGVCSFEFDNDIGFKVKSGIVTQIANTSKLTILRRRMADYLTNSVARFLKVYQNDVNSKAKRTAAKSAILVFDQSQEKAGILPKDSEVTDGKAKLVDIDSENDNDSIAAGKFIILYKRRIFSSMRFIVLKAEIGESVVVTESEEG